MNKLNTSNSIVVIPLLSGRVSPRCTFADSILVVTVKWGRIAAQSTLKIEVTSEVDLVQALSDIGADMLICDGISRSLRDMIEAQDITVVENVSGKADEIVDALPTGTVRPGFGFVSEDVPLKDGSTGSEDKGGSRTGTKSKHPIEPLNCLTCEDRICLRGESCLKESIEAAIPDFDQMDEMLEAAMDVSSEEERKLCRLAELVYYFLGLKYKRIGVAFCLDLLEPATILTRVLQRFFEVIPVCCKVGGVVIKDEPTGITGDHQGVNHNRIACNPLLQAEILNRAATDVNVIVGLCVGIDCLFNKASRAPVTTVFVKDKSLANNPIGAVYSDYYLKEI